MKKFSFRLEPLLSLKKQREEEEMRKLAVVVGKMNLLQDEINSLSSEVALLGEQMSGKIHSGSNLRDYMEYEETTRYLYLRIHSLEKQYEENAPDLELARIRFLEASRERKVLEILKENEKKLYSKKRKREEKRELAEVIYTLSQLDPEFFALELPKGAPSSIAKPLADLQDEDYWMGQSSAEEVRPKEEPLTEMEKLKQYYDEYIKK